MTLYDVKIEDEKVHLNWVTATEKNNDYFIIQRSEDGNIWETIGVRKGKGNSIVENTYEMIDEKPLNGISYYRLKQVDFDGKYTFTPLRSIKNSKELDFTLYPLPAKDQVIINYNHEKIDQIQLIDVLGNQIEVIQKNINGESILDVSDLKSGIYTVILTVGDKTINRKLIKA